LCRGPSTSHDGKIEFYRGDRIALGLFDEADYDEPISKAKPGDLFVFYSDVFSMHANRDGHLLARNVWRRSSPAAPLRSADAW